MCVVLPRGVSRLHEQKKESRKPHPSRHPSVLRVITNGAASESLGTKSGLVITLGPRVYIHYGGDWGYCVLGAKLLSPEAGGGEDTVKRCCVLTLALTVIHRN